MLGFSRPRSAFSNLGEFTVSATCGHTIGQKIASPTPGVKAIAVETLIADVMTLAG